MRGRAGVSCVAVIALGGFAGCGEGKMTTKEVFEKGRPATVEISGKQGENPSGGTGVIYDAKRGLVVTNAHVVTGLTSLKAKVNDQTTVPVRVLGVAPCEDLAVVQMQNKPEGLKQASFGKSKDITNQDEVTALGYPTSFEDPEKQKVVSTNGTVQSPNVSATPDKSSPKLPATIQHSATINPGNSGGPLFNDKGELVGINTLYNPGEERPVQGQYYAIASDHAKQIVSQLASGKSLANPGWNLAAFSEVPLSRFFEQTGFGTAEEGTLADRQLASRGVDGVFVTGVESGSAAEKADPPVEPGDLIRSINGTPVPTVADACEVLQSASPGQALKINGVVIASGDRDDFGNQFTTNVTAS